MAAEQSPRRVLLMNWSRLLIGACLAFLGLHLFFKARNPHVCVNRGICRDCDEFAACILPQAMSAKQAGVER